MYKKVSQGDAVIPALSVFFSGGVARTTLRETAGLHFPPDSDQPKSTAYGPIHGTADPAPTGQSGGKIIYFTILLYSLIIQSEHLELKQQFPKYNFDLFVV